MNIKNIIRLHNLILIERTGSPKNLAQKLEVSERTIYNYINFMKEELNTKIRYNSEKCSYSYEGKCNLCFEG